MGVDSRCTGSPFWQHGFYCPIVTVFRCSGWTYLLPFDFEGWIPEGLAVLVDLLEDALVINRGGVVVPQQGVLPALLGIVAYFGQIHAGCEMRKEK